MTDIRKYLDIKKKAINKALDKYLPSRETVPKVIHRAMRYAVFSGGKRIRPILTIASFEACGKKGDSIVPIACAVELIHTYTLIHDDMPCMDNDDLRRGKSNCHKKFNEAIALLAGDALLTFGFQLLSDSGNIEIAREVSRAVGSQGTIGGQVVDIDLHSALRPCSGQAKRTPYHEGTEQVAHSAELDYVVSNKTGALFRIACEAGAIFSNAGKKKIKALGDFGKNFGVTFQLVDDLIDKDGYIKVYGADHVEK
ncbi:MAG: polyprenyl synthetase family protein, partial [Candidatus Omnitrophica bacterium]|nr:polyprenyl synthetase family protein [Candidatus Omnitrophota bacterium]